MLPFQWDRRSVFIQLQVPENLVGTRVEPLVYVHNHHLQLRGDASIPSWYFYLFLQALSPNKPRNIWTALFTTYLWIPFIRKKNSPTVLKQRKELLWRLYPHTHTHTKKKKTKKKTTFTCRLPDDSSIYYSLSSQTCLLFQRKIIFYIIWFPFIVTVRTQTKY